MSRFRTVDIVMFAFAVVFLLLLLGGGVLLFRERANQQAAQQSAELIIDRLKARDIPTDFASLHALYDQRTSTEDSAAWNRILAILKSNEFVELLRAAHRNGTNPKNDAERLTQLKLQRELIQKFESLIAEIHALAAKRKSVRFNFNLEEFETAPIDQTRQLARLLSCESNVAIAGRDSQRLRQSVQTQLNILRVYSGSDLIIDHLIRAAVYDVALSNIRAAIEANALNEADLTSILDELYALRESKQDWPQVVQTERAYMLPYLTGQAVDKSSEMEAIAQANGKDLLNFLTFMDRFEKVDWTNWKTAKAELETISSDFNDKIANAGFLEKRNWKMSSMSISAWNTIGETLAHSECFRNQTIMGCALRLYQIKRGKFPDKLDALKEIAIDPEKYLSLADVPFGYQLQNETAYLWGPIRGSDYAWPLTIEASIPQVNANMSAEEIERIKNSIITLSP